MHKKGGDQEKDTEQKRRVWLSSGHVATQYRRHYKVILVENMCFCFVNSSASKFTRPFICKKKSFLNGRPTCPPVHTCIRTHTPPPTTRRQVRTLAEPLAGQPALRCRRLLAASIDWRWPGGLQRRSTDVGMIARRQRVPPVVACAHAKKQKHERKKVGGRKIPGGSGGNERPKARRARALVRKEFLVR